MDGIVGCFITAYFTSVSFCKGNFSMTGEKCAQIGDKLRYLPVSQVAASVGYRPERLAELFSRLYGTTPSAYRTALARPSALST